MRHNLRDNPCYDFTRHPENGKKRCPQCWAVKPFPSEFIGLTGGVIQVCSTCAQRRSAYYKTWRERRALSENRATPDRPEDETPRKTQKRPLEQEL